MRSYNRQHRHDCGIDLHVKTMYVCILDATGQVLVHRNIKTTPAAFLEIVAPYREDLVVAVECVFTWYWLADVCAAEGIGFVLGHALAMKAIHGGKAKNDKLDSHKIAVLLRGGLLPQAYVYPPPCDRRATYDAVDCLWAASAGSSWPTFRTPAPNTTCQSSAAGSPIRPIATACRTILAMRVSARASKSTSLLRTVRHPHQRPRTDPRAQGETARRRRVSPFAIDAWHWGGAGVDDPLRNP